jgi:BON domain
MNKELMNRWRANLDEARQLARETAQRAGRTRVTTESRTNGWWLALIALVAGAAGAAAMYLLDPAHGRRRRAMLADRSAAALRDAGQQADKARRLAGGRLGGLAQEAFHIGDDPMPNDASLAAKVETELFRDPSVPKGNININVEDGRVVLRGEVESARQRAALTRRAKGISGVTEVENLLHVPGEPIVASNP